MNQTMVNANVGSKKKLTSYVATPEESQRANTKRSAGEEKSNRVQLKIIPRINNENYK